MIRRLLALVLVVFCAAACASSAATSPKPSDLNDNPGTGTFQGFGTTPAQPRPQFTLTDTAGKPFAFGTVTSKHPTLLFFGYTHCPDDCPTTMQDVHLALQQVPASVMASTYVVFVTTDVKRDSGPVIAKWLAKYQRGTTAHWVGLTGTQAGIDAAQAAAHVTIAEDDGETHSNELLLYGPDDYAHVYFLVNNLEQRQIVHDLPVVAAGRS